MPDWSPDGLHMVYAQSSEVNPTGDPVGIDLHDALQRHDLGHADDMVLQQTTENNYYPALLARRHVGRVRSLAGDAHESFSNASPDEDAGNGPRRGAVGGGRDGGNARTTLDGIESRSAVVAEVGTGGDDYYGGNHRITFSSLRAYGLRLSAGEQTQLWMVAVYVTKLGNGEDPSFPAFWLPFQDISGGNHTRAVEHRVVRASCSGGDGVPDPRELHRRTCQQE